MPARISRDQMLMEIAHVISHRGTCERSQVGVVLARDSRVISTGYVGSPSGSPHCSDVGCELGNHGGCIRTIHAEANAIAYAARVGVSTQDCTIYSTLAPCRECAKLIINTGIKRLVYHHSYRDPGGLRLLEDAKILIENFAALPKVDYGK